MKRKQTIALELAAMGLRIIPVQANRKKPTVKAWPETATTNEATIRQWFAESPEMNYGILTGPEVQVLDLDIKQGKNGVQAFKSLCGSDPFVLLENTLVVQTPSGGFHFYLMPVAAARTRHLPEGIDYQSDGAFVLGPGSVIDGQPYRIVSSTTQIAGLLDERCLTQLGVLGAEQATRDIFTADPAESLSGVDSRLLEQIDPGLPYDGWRDAIFAFLNLGGGVEPLQVWSMNGLNWDAAAFRKVVDSYDPDRPQKLGDKRLRELAKAYPAVGGAVMPKADRDVSELKAAVLAEVIDLLEHHGNRPTEEHVRGLDCVVEAMVSGSYSEDKFRLSFPLETGMGKTTCVIALAKCLQHTDRTLLVCAEQIDQLADLWRELLAEGVDPSKVGIFHNSDRHRGTVPSVSVEELPKLQILLASHNRVKSDTARTLADRLLYVERDGGLVKRDLVIWDESLITTRPIYVGRTELRQEINNWMIEFEERNSRRHGEFSLVEVELREFMKSVAEELHKKIGEQDCEYVFGRSLGLTHATADYLPLAGSDTLKNLLYFHANGRIRQLNAKAGRVLVQFVAEVDDAFDKIIILDASARIRDLVLFDQSIAVVDIPLSKDYSAVVIHQGDVKSSKQGVRDRRYFRSMLQELLLILESLPKGEEALVFSFKDYRDEVTAFISEQHPFRKVHVLHWGQHRASNRYAEVKYLVTVGVLYRDPREIASSLLAQSRDLGTRLEPGAVRSAELGEQADLLYQAISRGHSRKTFDGRAGEQTIYLLHPDKECKELLPILQSQMKGVQVERYIPKVVKPARFDPDEPIVVLSDEIAGYLGNLPESEKAVSQRKLRNAIGREDVSSNSYIWRSAKKRALDYVPQFEEMGRSFVRR